MAMSAVRHSHPIHIAENLSRYLFLLIIPILRGLLSALEGGSLLDWAVGAWMDLLVLAAMVIMSVIEWYFLTYDYNSRGIIVSSGIVVRRRYFIPAPRICTLSLVRPYYLKPFHAVKLRADTLAGGSQRADFVITIPESEGNRIMGIRESRSNQVQYVARKYNPQSRYVFALALVSSDSFAGMVFLSTLVSKAGELLGEEFSNRLYGTLEWFTQAMAFGIPPAAAAIAYLLLFSWLFSFLVNLIRYKNLTIVRRRDNLHVSGGIITNRDYSINCKQISYLDIRQSVLTRLLGLHAAYVHISGFDKEREDFSAVIPVTRSGDLKNNLKLLLPEFQVSPRILKPNLGAIFKFILEPLWPCILVPLGTFLLSRLFPSWSSFIWFVGLMSSLPAYWFLTVRMMDFFTSGVGKSDGYYTLRYSRGFFLHTVVIPADQIAGVWLRQSILQRGDGKCDLIVFSFSEGRKRHHCKNLDWDAVAELFELS